MSDPTPHIFLHGLSIESLIGVYAVERNSPQTLLVDVEAGLPSVTPFLSDQIADTIDYAVLADLIRTEASRQSFTLLERLAHHLCERICQRFGSPWVQIRIVKPNIVPGAQAVGVSYRHQPAA